MNSQGSGWGGGSREGKSVPLPKKTRPFRYFPEDKLVRSPFPPLDPEEGKKILQEGKKKPPGSSLSEAEQEKILALRRQGASLKKISEETAFSTGQVRGVLRKHKMSAGSNAKLTPDQRQAIRVRYAAGGVTHAALAREYGVSSATIANVVKGS